MAWPSSAHGRLAPGAGRLASVARRLVSFGLLVAVVGAPASAPTLAQAQAQGSLNISPATGGAGSKFEVHGVGFVNFSLITKALDLTVFDANNVIVDHGSVAANDDGSIDAVVDTSNGLYTSGTYSVLASYTYWGVRRDPLTDVIICGFCPTKTVPLADSVTFTIE